MHFPEGTHHDVVRLHIAVNHAAFMREGQRFAHALHDAQDPALGPLGVTLSQALVHRLQGHARDQLHREVGPTLRIHTYIVHGHDARVIQLAGDARFV